MSFLIENNYMKFILIFFLILVFSINFLYISILEVYAFDFVMTSIAIKLFVSLLVAAGVTFTAISVSDITQLYDYWKYINPTMVLKLSNAAYSSILDSSRATIDSSLWNSIRDFAQSHFKTGTHTEVIIEDTSGGGSPGYSTYTLNEFNTYWFDSSYSTGDFLKVYQAVWSAENFRNILGYTLDSKDRLISPNGTVIVDPADFNYLYDEVTWNLYFDPNTMSEAEVSCAWLGATSHTISSVPIQQYNDDSITLNLSMSSTVSLPVPYSGNPVLDNPNHDFENNETKRREVGFPWLGSKPIVGGGKDLYNGNIEDLLEETNSISQHLQTDLDRIINLTANDVINGGIDSAKSGSLEVDGVLTDGLVLEKDFGLSDTGTVDPPIPGEIDLTGVLGLLQGILSALGSFFGNILSLLNNLLSTITNIFTISDSINLDFTPLQGINLTTKFPFSIPWDLANSFNNFNVAPIIPNWSIDLLGYSVVVDFAIFEPWAKIVRWGVLIFFNIGLIKLTRNLIRG